jgi:hypothetical protein
VKLTVLVLADAVRVRSGSGLVPVSLRMNVAPRTSDPPDVAVMVKVPSWVRVGENEHG